MQRWKHLKRGTEYVDIGEAEVQCSQPINEGDKLVVYLAEEDGKLWARPASEFFDGRYEQLNPEVPMETSSNEEVIQDIATKAIVQFMDGDVYKAIITAHRNEAYLLGVESACVRVKGQLQ
jgi:hypothetical protein